MTTLLQSVYVCLLYLHPSTERLLEFRQNGVDGPRNKQPSNSVLFFSVPVCWMVEFDWLTSPRLDLPREMGALWPWIECERVSVISINSREFRFCPFVLIISRPPFVFASRHACANMISVNISIVKCPLLSPCSTATIQYSTKTCRLCTDKQISTRVFK